ncbi:MAG: GerMN domain-containing protein [Candidatus Korobacteraceae bacterium]
MTRPILIMFAVLLFVAAGLGFYAYHLKNKVALEEQHLAQQAQVVVPPPAGPTTLVTFYVASDADGTLHRTQDNVALPQERSERARAVLRALFAKYSSDSTSHPIGSGSDVRDVFLMGGNTAIVDTTAGFADSHPSGVLAEELTIASIVNTLNANDPQITRVKILVDGKERETLAGHADLRRFYLASGIGQVMKDTQ